MTFHELAEIAQALGYIGDYNFSIGDNRKLVSVYKEYRNNRGHYHSVKFTAKGIYYFKGKSAVHEKGFDGFDNLWLWGKTQPGVITLGQVLNGPDLDEVLALREKFDPIAKVDRLRKISVTTDEQRMWF